MKRKIYASVLLVVMLVNTLPLHLLASSHREAPMIANDPLADLLSGGPLAVGRINSLICLGALAPPSQSRHGR